MARTFQEIYGDSIKSVKALREEVKSLQGALIGASEDTEQYKETTEKLWAAQDELTKVTAKSKKEMVAAEDSIVGMERKYKELYNTYKTMSESMRNSDIGKSTAESLKTLSENLNKTKMDVGNFKDNIGHYSEGVIDAFGKMGLGLGAFQAPFNTLIAIVGQGKDSMENNLKNLGSSIQGLSSQMSAMGGPAAVAKVGLQGVGSAMKALIANPVGAVIMAIVVAFKALSAIANKVKEAINGNEESQMRLSEAMSAFQPVVDAVNNAFDKLGQTVVKVIGFFGDAFRKIREIGAAATDFLGITKGAKKQVQEQNKLYKELAVSQNNLTKQKREYQKLDAKDKAEVERLREEASETTNLADKKRLLEEAKAKQAEIDARNIEIAKEEARILQEQANLTANDAEMNDKLAAALAKVSEAEATAAANARQFNRQLNQGAGGAGSYGGAVKSARQEAKELYEQLVEDSKTEVQKLTEKYEKEKKLLERYHKDTTLLTKQYNENINRLNEEAEQKKKDAVTAQLTATKAYNDWARAIDSTDEMENQMDILGNQMMHLKAFQDTFKSLKNSADGIIPIDKIKEAVERFNILSDLKIEFPPKTSPEALQDFEETIDKMVKNAENVWHNFLLSFNDAEAEKRIGEQVGAAIVSGLNSELDAMKNGMDSGDFAVLVAENARKELEATKSALDEELEHFSGTNEKKLELMQRYYDTLAQLRQADEDLEKLSVERRTQMYDDMTKNLGSIGQSFGSLISSQKTLIDAQEKDGKISEREAKKKKKNLETLARIQRDLAMLSIAGDTASAIIKVWNAYAAERVVNAETAAAAGPAAAAVLAGLNAKSLISAIANTAGIAANGAAQLAAAQAGYVSTVNNLRGDGGADATASVAAPAEIDSTPYTYTRTVQTTEEEDELNRPIWVSVEDISSSLNHRARVKDESSF